MGDCRGRLILLYETNTLSDDSLIKMYKLVFAEYAIPKKSDAGRDFVSENFLKF